MNITERRRNTKRVQLYSKNLTRTVAASTLIAGSLIYLVKYLSSIHNSQSIWIDLIVIVLLPSIYIIVGLFEEGFFSSMVFNFMSKLRRKEWFEDNWRIEIEYDVDGVKKHRSGECKIESDITGIRIEGFAIKDQDDNIEVHSWLSNNVEIIDTDKVTLVYVYYTYETDSELIPTKIGMGILQWSQEKDQFSGLFRDYKIADGKTEKKGDVKLIRSNL